MVDDSPSIGVEIDFERLNARPEQEVAALCRINLGDLVSTMATHPSFVAYATALHETAKVDVAKTENRLKRMRVMAFHDLEIRNPKRAISKLEKDVEMDERVKTLTDNLEQKQQRAGALRALVAGLSDRRDMLMNIAGRQRDEYKSTHH